VHVAAVIGHPVGQSLSPALHNAAFEAAGLDWRYVAFDVAPGAAGAALDAMRTLGIAGCR
jgi:shikimate dehydrogenase